MNSAIAQQLASSVPVVTGDLSNQSQGRHGPRGSVTKTNCVDINGSNANGLTISNGGVGNSGSGASFFCRFP